MKYIFPNILSKWISFPEKPDDLRKKQWSVADLRSLLAQSKKGNDHGDLSTYVLSLPGN